MEGKSSDWRPGPTVCRCCLSEGCYKDISTEYFWMGRREVYSEMLSETLDLSIAYSNSNGPNSNSRLICEQCISRLRDASEFKRQVIDCEKTFMQHLNPGSSSKSGDFLAESISDVKVEAVKHEKESFSDDDFDDRPDFLDVDSDDDLDNQPLTKLASKIPKKEAIDILELLDTSQITVKRKSNLKTKEPPKKILKKKETKAAPRTVSKAAPKQADKKKGVDEPPRKKTPEQEKNEERRLNLLILLDSSRICPYRWKKKFFVCLYCDKMYPEPAKLREHNLKHQNKNLAEIKKALFKISRVELLKVDVTDVSCKLCDTSIDNVENLVKHLNGTHKKNIRPIPNFGFIPFKNELDDYRCGICDENFQEYVFLRNHMNTHFPNFTCDVCGKGYISAFRLRTHKHSHEKGNWPCDACDKVYNSKYSKTRHYARVHIKANSHSCLYCTEKFPGYYQRQKHLAIAHGIKTEYKCDLCPYVASRKGHLDAHFRCKHLHDKRFVCEICGAMFFSKVELEKQHMLKHNVGRSFECDDCPKKYFLKKQLDEHKKTHLKYKQKKSLLKSKSAKKPGDKKAPN